MSDTTNFDALTDFDNGVDADIELNEIPIKNLETVDDTDLSLSELDILANQKKLKKEEDLPEIKAVDTLSSAPSSSTFRSVGSTVSTYTKKRRQKTISKENENEYIRKQKSELLYKFNKLNEKKKWSSLRLDMNNSLEEIRNECDRISSVIKNEKYVAFLKRMLLLGVQGVEMLNTKFDPLGVDLDGWSESMGYSLENDEYDEVLSELYEKHKSKVSMSPEVKLVFMIISSAAMFGITKKITQSANNGGLSNFINSMMAGNNSGSAPTVNVNNNTTEYETEDIPSKLNGPSDDVNINDILRTMQERKNEEEKNIEFTKPKKRGRKKATS